MFNFSIIYAADSGRARDEDPAEGQIDLGELFELLNSFE